MEERERESVGRERKEEVGQTDRPRRRKGEKKETRKEGSEREKFSGEGKERGEQRDGPRR